jgi:hypothetical protein
MSEALDRARKAANDLQAALAALSPEDALAYMKETMSGLADAMKLANPPPSEPEAKLE